jgi:hypothetical protein
MELKMDHAGKNIGADKMKTVLRSMNASTVNDLSLV